MSDDVTDLEWYRFLFIFKNNFLIYTFLFD